MRWNWAKANVGWIARDLLLRAVRWRYSFPRGVMEKPSLETFTAKVDKTWKDIWGTEGFSKGCGDWVIYQVLPWGAHLSWLTELVEPDLISAHSSVLQEAADRVSWSSLKLRRFMASSQFVQHNHSHAMLTPQLCFLLPLKVSLLSPPLLLLVGQSLLYPQLRTIFLNHRLWNTTKLLILELFSNWNYSRDESIQHTSVEWVLNNEKCISLSWAFSPSFP